jgi:hypothetical protein
VFYGTISPSPTETRRVMRDLAGGPIGDRQHSSPAPLCTAQSVESAPSLLCGTWSEVGSEWAGEAMLAQVPLTGGLRLRRLRVHRGCDACGATAIGDSGDSQRSPERASRHLDRVRFMDGLRGLYPLPVEMYSSREDSVGGHRACLEQPCRPEPLVDSHLMHHAIIATAMP